MLLECSFLLVLAGVPQLIILVPLKVSSPHNSFSCLFVCFFLLHLFSHCSSVPQVHVALLKPPEENLKEVGQDTARRCTGVGVHRGEERRLQNEFLEEQEQQEEGEEEEQEQQEEEVNAAIVEKMEELHSQHRVAGSCYLLSVFLRWRFQAEMCVFQSREEKLTPVQVLQNPLTEHLMAPWNRPVHCGLKLSSCGTATSRFGC